MAKFEICEVACTSALPLKLSEFVRHAKWDKTQVQWRAKFAIARCICFARLLQKSGLDCLKTSREGWHLIKSDTPDTFLALKNAGQQKSHVKPTGFFFEESRVLVFFFSFQV